MSIAIGTYAMTFNNDHSCTSSSSSSIGKNSDLSDEEEEEKDASEEVQSKFSGRGAFDSLQALEQVLPIRRGISSFYSGKSKSFACLSTSSVKHIAKPDNAYSRKRRNLIASATHVWDRLHRTSDQGIHKRSSFMHTSRSTLALGIAMSSSSSGSSEDSDCSRSGSHSHLPPLHPN